MKRFVCAVLCLLALMLSFCVCAEQTSGKQSFIGTMMQDFSVTDVDGKDITLSGLLEQYDAVYVNFFFNGCFWCGLEFPALETAWENHRDHVAVVALSPYDDPDEIAEYAKERGLSFSFAADEGGMSDTYAASFPTSLLISKEGVICWMSKDPVTNPAVYEAMFSDCTSKTPKELIGYKPPVFDTIHPAVDPAVLSAALGGDTAFTWESGGTDLYAAFTAGAADEGVSFMTSAKENAVARMTGSFTASAGDTVSFHVSMQANAAKDSHLEYGIFDAETYAEVCSGDFEDGDNSYSFAMPEDGNYILVVSVQTVMLETSLTLSDFRLTHAN